MARPSPSSSSDAHPPAFPGGDDGFGPVLRGGDGWDDAPVLRGEARPLERPPEPRDEPGPPPVVTRPRRGRRVAKVALVLLLVALLAVPATGVALALYANAKIQRAPVAGLAAGGSPMNVLVIGSDSREGLTPEELLALGTEAVSGQRTDTIFLLTAQGGRAALLAFPRDLFVTRCDGTRGRINGAFAIGGAGCLVQTVSAVSGIPIHHAVEVNFSGFKRIVDAVGGVQLHLDAPLTDRFAGIDLPAGCQVLSGTQALGFVRARKVDNDLGRIARQQQFLRELAEEVTRPATLLNPPRLFRIAGAAGGSVRADTELGIVDLVRLAPAVRGMAGGGVATYTVPATGRSVNGAAVLVPVDGEADALFARFRDGSVLSPPPAPSAGDAPPAEVAPPAEPAPAAGAAPPPPPPDC